jgi:hypothetical protein
MFCAAIVSDFAATIIAAVATQLFDAVTTALIPDAVSNWHGCNYFCTRSEAVYNRNFAAFQSLRDVAAAADSISTQSHEL